MLLTKDDAWVVVASDGLFENEVRGGGGGLSNAEVAELLTKNKNKPCKELVCDAVRGRGTGRLNGRHHGRGRQITVKL